MSSRTAPAWWFTAWMVSVAGLYYAVPAAQVRIWALIGLSGAVAVVVGVHLHRPRRRTPWLLIALGLLIFTGADVTAAVLNPVESTAYRIPLWLECVYLVMFLVISAGLTGLARSESARQSRASLLDAITLTAGVGLLCWIYLIDPRIHAPDLTPLQHLTAITYPLADLLLLAMVARLVLGAQWTPSVVLFAVGGVSFFLGDMAHLVASFDGHWAIGSGIDLTWIVLFWAWGTASLLPSMTQLSEIRLGRPNELTARRLALLTLCSLIPPTVLMVEAMRGPVEAGGMIAVGCAVMFGIVLIRLIDAMRLNRQSLGRERTLREAGAALVAATDDDDVTTVVRVSVRRLLPSGSAHWVLLDTGANTDRQFSRHAELRRTADLPPGHLLKLGGFELVLSCPLIAGEGSGGDSSLGELLVSADGNLLSPLQGALEVLALQAAMALSRIKLSREINRHDSQAYFRALVLNAADVILILDDRDEIRYSSPSATGMFGREQLTGINILDVVAPDERMEISAFLDQVRIGRGLAEGTDWTVLGVDCRRIQVEVSCRDLSCEPTVAGLVLTLRDVTDQRQLERELTHRAFHDSLTGLANRALFTDRVAQAVERSRKTGSVAGVLFLDLDDFKIVNDTQGHAIGDELLEVVAARLAAVVRPDDTAARLGGDEFAALIEDAADEAVIESIAERVVQAMSTPVAIGDHLVNAMASVGVATTAHAGDVDELMRHADLALYTAKGEGKSQWRRYQPQLHLAVVEQLRLRADLDRAIVAEEFSLRFQPVVGLVSGDTVGLEALVRWEHPTRGTLSPGEFIGVAEESGLIVPIGTAIVRQAFAAAAAWPASPAGEAPYVGVNISVRQFRTPGIVEDLSRELDEAGLPPDRLMLEITESLLLGEDEQVWGDLAKLRETGVRIAIDDFGTGYSSLSYLRQVALDVVKIDRSFVRALASSDQQRALVEGIVHLAHTLGLEVIAEGIETQRERDILAEIGCPYGQGYLFSPPMEPDESVKWLLTEPSPA